MEILRLTSLQTILFIVIYSITGVMPLIAALYLLLRRGNAFAPDTTPPLRLRRWSAAFFAVAALAHVWWFLFLVFSGDIRSLDDLFHSAGYWATVVLDGVTMLPTIAGTLLSMLQDRRRPVWPVIAALMPFVAMGGVLMAWPNGLLMQIGTVYILLLYVLFAVYVAFAVRQYGRWLRDNYADLEHKEVWLTHVVSLVFVLLLIFYSFIDANIILLYLLNVLELAIFGLLLWRVETLPNLETHPQPLPMSEGSGQTQGEEQSSPLHYREGQGGGSVNIDLAQIERLLNEHCVAPQLYLKHNLSLQELAQAVGTNRFYLSQYFSRQGITYSTYINNLRVNHFISRYQEVAASQQPFTVQQLAIESGYRSYSTFSRAFTQRIGQTVTAWMCGRPDC